MAQTTSEQTPPAAQQDQGPVFSVTSRLVVLDVVVTDKAGHLVPGLTQKDFTVYEDKEPQTIRSFEGPELHHLAPDVKIESTADLGKAPQAPVTILVLDELNTSFQDMSYARHELEKYLLSQPAELPQPTTLLAATNTKFQVLVDYTRDRQAVLTALDKHFPQYPWALMQSGKGGPGTAERLAQSLGSLQQIAHATAGHPGRKNLIWVGRGFPAVNTNESTDKQAAVIQNAVQQVIDTLRDARVTLTSIDPTINSTDTVLLETPDDLDAAEDENGNDPFQGDVNFQLLAPATGGRIYFSRNDVDAEISETLNRADNYYTLSYSPTNRNDLAQPYRRISVSVDRPGLKASTRNGYYIQTAQPAPPATAQDARELRARLAFDLGSAVNSNIAYTGLPLTVSRVPGQADTFVIHVNTQALLWRDTPNGGSQAEVTLAVASFNKQNKMLAHAVDERIARLNAQAGPAEPAATDFTMTASIPAGATHVRFAVRDAATGKMGTADFDPRQNR
jgi:VWFA-related protein